MNLNMLGQTFPISEPYAEGHVCTVADARTLNQTRLENISNNLRKQLTAIRDEGVAEGQEGEWDDAKLAKAAELVQKKDAEYTFSMGRSGGGAAPRDPVASEARKIATDHLAAKLKERGTTLAAQRKANKEAIDAKIDELASNEKVIAKAKKIVAQRKEAASLFEDISIGGEPEEAAA